MTKENSSGYVAMFTHGFTWGYLHNIDNKTLKKLAIQNYKNRYSKDPNRSEAEDIIIPTHKEVKKIEKLMSDEYKKLFGKELISLKAWAQVHYKGESTNFHSHLPGGTDLAGVYYVDIPKNSGDLILKYKRHEFDASRWIFPPETNKFIIFDAGVEHGVPPNLNSKPRVAIAINFKIKQEENK